MCGIAGVVGGRPDRDVPATRAMVEAIAHRGPDDTGVWSDEVGVLGNCRLQIIDLAAGHQPLSNQDGTLWITFNGEIYNYRELREGLRERGHRFRTHTDTEVLLHLYEERGSDCLTDLRGMFAFAIWDTRRRRLFAARDRFGQKPFYYARLGSRLAFCSEIKGLLRHPDVGVEPEPLAVDDYLALRFVSPPRTLFRGIEKLPRAAWLNWEDGRVSTGAWWEPGFPTVEGRSDEEWIEGLRTHVDDAVRAHMVSDVEVGAFLSGGLDSGMVVASMARRADAAVRTFAVGSDRPEFDERPYARRVAEHCDTNHFESIVNATQFEEIPRIVRCLDEPSDPISACVYEASRLAAEQVKVVLGGDGGDELLGGFDRYAAFDTVDRFRRIPAKVRNGLIRPVAERIPLGFGYKDLGEQARWVLDMADREGGRRYARMTTFFRFGPRERSALYGPRLDSAMHDGRAEAAIVAAFEEAPTADTLHRMIYADLRTRFPEHTLMLSDRLSMAHGLELRAPLLDNELADYCLAIPPRLKIRGRETKHAFRRAAEGRLPPKIIRRDKQGFMFPIAQWLKGDGATGHIRRLTEGPLVRDEWIRPEAPRRLVAEHRARRADHHVRIWMLLNLDAWYRIYIEGENW
ncbi:MAG: asparagine synthase (glutamine-hydrolyzing) [Gemmatimonadota bacterium]